MTGHVSKIKRFILNFFLASSVACILLLNLDIHVKSESPFQWMAKDNFDLIMEKMARANPDNCETLSETDLRLEANTLNQLPAYNMLLDNQWFANRSKLLHLHNIALNRGFFYSYVLQRLNTTADAPRYLPMLMYYYFSAAADISSGPNVLNVSAVLYDTNTSYADWFMNKDINTTLPLFGPMARRLDNWNDEMNFLRVPSNQTIEIHDLGAGPNSNYTASWYKNNPYIRDKEMGINFIPDLRGSAQDKSTYITKLLLADVYGNPMSKPETKTFFGPNAPGLKETNMPVRFTRPYFDCGKTNRWLVSAVSSVTDYMPRYSSIDRLRGARRIAVTLTSIDFLLIDFNPCPAGIGNQDYYLAGTARCKPTTMCVPISGYGFARGGYECVCQPGYRLPVYQVGPFRGVDIEIATQEEYEAGFDCIPVGWREVYPQEGRTIIRQRRMVDKVKEAARSVRDGIIATPGLLVKSGLNYLGYQTPDPDEVETEPHYIDNSAGREESKSPVALKLEADEKKNRLMKVYHERLLKNTLGKKQKAVLMPKFELPELIMNGYEEEKFCQDVNSTIDSLNPINFLWTKDKKESCIKMVPKPPTSKNESETLSRTKRSSLDDIEDSPFYTINFDSVFNERKFDEVHRLIAQVDSTTELNCHEKTVDELNLPGEVSYGVDKQFEMEGRTALRLAHFLSAYLQNNIMGEVYGSLKSGYSLNRFQLFGEVIANVLSNFEIVSSGIYFDYQTFKDHDDYIWDLFAPYAFKPKGTTQGVETLDMSINQYRNYTETQWFRSLKERWSTSTFGLERYLTKAHIRSQWEGFSEQRYFNFPMYYRAARYEDGFWTHPYFDCTGPKKDWLITYAAPFFGPLGPEKQLNFLGVVTVSVSLLNLDINQCPQSFYTPNFFKNTAKCHFGSTFCSHIPGREFNWGSYKCQCRQGYEFPLNSLEWYFDGETMETEFIAKRANQKNRFDILRCRQSGAKRSAHFLIRVVYLSLFFIRMIS